MSDPLSPDVETTSLSLKKSKFKILDRVRRLMLLILIFSVVYVFYVIQSSGNKQNNYLREEHSLLVNEVDDLVQYALSSVGFASFSIVPRETLLAYFIEEGEDVISSMFSMLKEIKQQNKLSGVYLIDHRGVLHSTYDVYRSANSYATEFLKFFHFNYSNIEGADIPADIGLFSPPVNNEINEMSSSFLGLNPEGIYAVKAIPLSFDQGGYAGKIYLIQEVFSKNLEIPYGGAFPQIETFKFISRYQQHDLMAELDLNVASLWHKLFISYIHNFYIPIRTKVDSEHLGVVKITVDRQDYGWKFIVDFLTSFIPVLFSLLIVLYLYRLLLVRIILPVEEMADVSKKIILGSTQSRLTFMNKSPLNRRSEVDNLGERFNHLMDVLSQKQIMLVNINEDLEGLVEQRTEELTRANKSLHYLAHTDALTSIGNRHSFDVYWNNVKEKVHQDPATEVVFCLLDVDHFKGVNDTYGHQAGDRLLVTISQILSKKLKTKGRVFRLGGDEFAMVFTDIPLAEVLGFIQDILIDIQNFPASTIQIEESLGVSIGVASSANEGCDDVPELVRYADIAMYVAKTSIQYKSVIYDPVLHAGTTKELSHLNRVKLIEAIKTGAGLILYYQPIYSIMDKKVDYFEVLSRLEIDGEIIYPDIFIPIVERTSMQVEFDKMVVLKTLQVLKSGEIVRGCGVSINLSPEALLSSDLLEWFAPFEPLLGDHQVIIEITETSLITQLKAVSICIEKFKSRGFKVALDDFGSGYSSISYLAHLPVDIIKFDMSLAKAAFQQERSAQIIASLMQELLAIDYKIVVEGIEDIDMFKFIVAMSPTHFQGYFINRPNPIPDMSLDFLESL